MAEGGNFWRAVRNALACTLALLAVACGGGGDDGAASASRSASARVFNASPGGSILVLTSDASPNGEYYAEILNNEGLNQFSLKDASMLSASALNGYDVVLLGKTTLAPAQINALAHWVSAGGHLIAMAPDSQLAPLLGITPTGSAIADGYLQIDTSHVPGAGLVGQPVQYHGSAERYRLNGASSLASLYSDANRATAHPAVTMRAVGNGRASAFAYDLATSVVQTRQGNPAWQGQERDGVAPITPSDRFFGGTAPDWIDRGKVAIAQADEQQRLLANMIVGSARKPLPRFWYFPEGKKAVVVTTGDEQDGSAPSRWDTSWTFTSPVWSASGLFTGSAMPMRLSAADGKVLDVYQAVAQVDGAGQSVDALLDRALGAEGYYGAFAVRPANAAAAGRASANAAATARARGVPVLTTGQLLTWLDARNASSFDSLVWNGSALGFELKAAADAAGLQAMLPWRFGNRTLQSLERDGAVHEFSVKTIKGLDYAVFAGSSGNYVAQYGDASPASTNVAGGAGSASAGRARALAVHTAWGSGAVPANPSINEALPVELGVKFRTNVSGVVTGVRFYKGAGNTGTHTGSLWTAGGQLLASATFTGETATGWQQVSFATPVAISANTVYVASYFAPNGGYAYDSAYFAATGVVNGAVELLQNGVSGGNGVYAYNASSTFPANSFNATNYWVDVVFDDAGPADTTPPTVTSTLPANGATEVSATAQVRAVFSEAIDQSTLDATTFELRNASNALVPATVSYDAATRTAILTPSSALAASSVFSATVRGGSTDPRVKDLAGNALAANVAWSFTTSASTSGCPCSAFPANATPATASFAETLPLTLGVKFRTDVAGFITGIRFYKGSANTGTHVGSLWSSAGTLLGTATFTNETASGWQQVSFGAPIAVAPNTVYVASYFAPNGGFAVDPGYFAAAGVDNGPVHLLQNGVSGGNGVYNYGATSSFPVNSFNSSNYWVDVVFTTTAGPDNIAPSVASTTPASGGTGVAINSTIRAIFDEPLSAASVSGSTFELRNASNALITATVAYDAATQSATLQPTSALAINTTYTATLRGGAADPRIKDVAGNALAANYSWSFTTGGLDPCTAPPNPVVAENCLTGSPKAEWEVIGVGDPTIQGYATEISVNRGSTVNFKVATTATSYRLDIYRLGYYGGTGARKVATVLPSATLPQNQPACLSDPSTGLVDCGNWGVSASWAVPATAVSGVYIARLVRVDTGGNSMLPFIVRDDASSSDLLYKTSDSTWQAYNDYGGNSLYSGAPVGRAYKVSYNRPFNNRSSSFGRAFLFGAEVPMIRWLEANGYNVSYTSGVDVERTPLQVRNHRVLLSSGHDEYWSAGQRASVEGARDAGVHLAYFSGNQMFWKTRWENSIDGSGTPYRTLVSYKETHANAKIDPSSVWTGTWRDPRFSPPSDGGRPENALSGSIFKGNCCAAVADSILVPAAYGNMRLWRNTSVATLAAGQVATLAAGTLGYEWDEDVDNGFRPPGLIRLSETTTSAWPLLLDYGSNFGPGTATHHIVMHKRSNGALVFAAGTIRWSWGLDTTHDDDTATPGWSIAPDVRVQQATVNILADMSAQPGSLRPGLVAATASTDLTGPSSSITAPAAGATLAANTPVTITGSAADSGGGVVGGVEVSVDGATWHPATGRTSWSYSWTPTAGGPTTIRARAVDDSGNIQGTPASVNVTVSGGDTTPPTITASAPVGGATGVAVTANVTVTFSEAMDAATISTGTIELRDGANALVASAVSYDAATRVATLNPTPTLSASATYTVRVRGGATDPRVKDVAGNALAADASWSFSTAAASDGTPPTISARSPLSGATGVSQTANVTVTFSEAMDAATISTGTIELRDSANALVASAVSYDATTRVATLNPTPTLAAQAVYSVRVRGGATDPRVKDVAGNALAADSTWSFTTGGDGTAPTITTRSPASGATGVSRTANVTVTFSEAMNSSTINSGTFELRNPAGTLITASVSYNATSRVATLNPSPTLAALTVYTARVRGGASGVQDAAGNPLAADATWSFTTVADTTAPTVSSVSPGSGAFGVSRTGNVLANFSEDMDPATINGSTFELRTSGGALVSAVVSYSSSNRRATLNPNATLSAFTTYTATVRGGTTDPRVKDAAGNALAGNRVWSFTTGL
jgi:hypothetical protein